MKFTGSCIGKILLVILCIILGLVIAIGGEVLVVYLVLTKDGGMGKVDDLADNNGISIDFDEDIRELSILSWATELMGVASDMSANTIGDLERLLGASLISNTVENVLGVDASVIKQANLDNLASTVSDNITVANAKDKFGITLPDMPIFNDSDFLSKSLATAFGDFDSYTLGEFIEISDDSNAVLKELKDVAIKDIGSATTDETVKSMLLCQLMDIDENSSMTLQALKYSCIESQYNEDGSYKTKTITETVNGVSTEITVELIGINERIDTLYVKEVVEITEESSVVLRKMRTATEEELAEGKGDLFGDSDLLVNELGGSKVTDIINSTTIGEFIEVNEDSEPILRALENTTIDGLNERIKVLQLNEVLSAESLEDGALSLIPAETLLSDVSTEITAAIENATIATLIGKNILSESNIANLATMTKYEQKSFIYNSEISGLLSAIIDFIDDPYTIVQGENGAYTVSANYGFISPVAVESVETSFASLTEFINAYSQYSSVSFVSGGAAISAVSVTVTESDSVWYDEEAGAYLIPMFNLASATEITFAVDGNAIDVKLAVYSETDGELTLSAHQYGYAYSSGTTYLEGAYSTLITERVTDNTNNG